MYRHRLGDVAFSQTACPGTGRAQFPNQQVIDGAPHNLSTGIWVRWLVSRQKISRHQVFKGIQACVDQQFQRRQPCQRLLEHVNGGHAFVVGSVEHIENANKPAKLSRRDGRETINFNTPRRMLLQHQSRVADGAAYSFRRNRSDVPEQRRVAHTLLAHVSGQRKHQGFRVPRIGWQGAQEFAGPKRGIALNPGDLVFAPLARFPVQIGLRHHDGCVCRAMPGLHITGEQWLVIAQPRPFFSQPHLTH